MTVRLILIILIIIYLAASLRVASEHQRFALFRLGRYFGLKGPGVIIMMPIIDRCFQIAVGDQGLLIKDGIGKFKEAELPVDHSENISTGSRIKVKGFSNNKIQAALDADQRHVVKFNNN